MLFAGHRLLHCRHAVAVHIVVEAGTRVGIGLRHDLLLNLKSLLPQNSVEQIVSDFLMLVVLHLQLDLNLVLLQLFVHWHRKILYLVQVEAYSGFIGQELLPVIHQFSLSVFEQVECVAVLIVIVYYEFV